MQLITRYLAAVRRGLPAAGADDIIAELRDLLLSQAEAREAKLGRPLEIGEEEELLRALGRPLIVAARYGDRQALIGPDIYPFYRATLRTLLMIIVTLQLVLGGINAAFGSASPWQALALVASGLFWSIVVTAGIVTLVFAAIERRGLPRAHLDWKAADLPQLDDPAEPQREAPFEIALGAAFLLWWTGAIHFPTEWSAAHFAAAPVWDMLYWPIVALVSARMILSAISLAMPRLIATRFVLGAATTIAGLAILAILFHAGHWVVTVPGTMSADESARLGESVDLAIRIGLIVTAIAWSFAALGGLWKLWQSRAAGKPAA